MSEAKDMEFLLEEALAGFEPIPAKKGDKAGNPESKESPKADLGRQVLEDALKKLAQAQNIEHGDDAEAVPTDEDLEKMFAEFSMGADATPGVGEDLNQLLPVMENMMESLLSKELLYPPLKELAGKYPDWLAENRATLKESEFDNYNKQFEVTKQICHVFETATLDTDGKMTKQNFHQIFELMQKMQSHGHPPKELVGEMPSSPFSGDLAKDQCSIS